MIAVGGLGGSGTRVIAEVLIQSGIYMGDDLNDPNDNLIFTRLFKNPDWYKKSSDYQKQKRMSLFENYMRFNKLSLSQLYELYKASKSNYTFHSTSDFYLRVAKKLFNVKKESTNWGWKEPNTQIYMNEFLQYFDELKYIHVIRNGLDMAFSNNKQQLNNWGWKYNIYLNEEDSKNEIAVKQLNYWIESTKDVLEKSKKYNNRFLIINYNDFCDNPQIGIDKLLEFTGTNLLASEKEKLYKIPQKSSSNDRYKNKDLSIFDSEKIDFVAKLGFKL